MAPATPLSKASRVRICRGVMPRRSSSMTCRPDCLAMRLWRLDTAGAVPQPGRDMPSTSVSIHMELAVPRWAQLPTVGKAASSAFFISSTVQLPCSTRPGNSRSSLEQNRGLPPTLPGSMGPPVTTMAGMSSRAAAMSMPGMILSQPGMSTMASKWWACTTISMESAMRSRLGRG